MLEHLAMIADFVEANYSWDVVIDRLIELYARAAAGRR
jgi:glycosyltransferase involved in cell wall biosynthesis